MAADFTPREWEVLRLLAEFRTNKEIAESLVISPRTAEKHVDQILNKLDVADRREAGRLARRLMENA